jgi:hypothetical protein
MKPIKLITFLLLIILKTYFFGQKVTDNHIVNLKNLNTNKAMKLFENYISSKPQNQEKNEFWNFQE